MAGRTYAQAAAQAANASSPVALGVCYRNPANTAYHAAAAQHAHQHANNTAPWPGAALMQAACLDECGCGTTPCDMAQELQDQAQYCNTCRAVTIGRENGTCVACGGCNIHGKVGYDYGGCCNGCGNCVCPGNPCSGALLP